MSQSREIIGAAEVLARITHYTREGTINWDASLANFRKLLSSGAVIEGPHINNKCRAEEITRRRTECGPSQDFQDEELYHKPHRRAQSEKDPQEELTGLLAKSGISTEVREVDHEFRNVSPIREAFFSGDKERGQENIAGENSGLYDQ